MAGSASAVREIKENTSSSISALYLRGTFHIFCGSKCLGGATRKNKTIKPDSHTHTHTPPHALLSGMTWNRDKRQQQFVKEQKNVLLQEGFSIVDHYLAFSSVCHTFNHTGILGFDCRHSSLSCCCGDCVHVSSCYERSPPLPQVKRELAGVLIFESHAKAGTVCE